jgi:hypothetical protein
MLVAAADRLAERPALEQAPAAGAGSREHASLHEQGTHQRGPEECIGDEEWGAHASLYRPKGPIGLPLLR